MVINYQSSLGNFNLVDEYQVDKKQNIFTVVIGKNGTGKSVMLGNIVRFFTKSKRINWDYLSIERRNVFNYEPSIFYNGKPERVIAVSSSPFDKFPINFSYFQKRRNLENYTYLGIRDLRTTQFGNAYLARIASNIFSNIIYSIPTKVSILKVLDFLDFEPQLIFRFESRRAVYQEIIRHLEILNKAKDSKESIKNNAFPVSFDRDFYLNQDGTVSIRKLEQLQHILEKYFYSKRTLNFSIEIQQLEIRVKEIESYIFDDLVFLLESGYIRLSDTLLFRKGERLPVSLNEASSGEQSVFTSMLGIASSIRDNSLICIDEPEICLHPEWQERYIEMLTTVFEDFNYCHFIIATHSPQIISNLKANNCFILNLKKGDLISASSVINRSADYQLAEIFEVPGFRNEYLSRIALNLFTRVSRSLRFDDKDILTFYSLKDLKSKLEDNDPVKQIITALEKLREEYA